MTGGHCHVVENYGESLSRWSDSPYYAANVHKMQLPFTPTVKGTYTYDVRKIPGFFAPSPLARIWY